MNITMTEAARDYIHAVIQKQNGIGFRLSIKKTGCSGYAYQPAVINAVNQTDHAISVNGVMLYVDPLWQHLLEGISLDIVEDVKSGLKQKRLMISNQKESGRCGCGESFHIDNE